MNRPMVCLAVAAALCLLLIATHMWTRFENDVTVYMLSCDGAQMNGTCEGTETTDVPFSYHVSIDQHSVLYWRVNDPGLIRRFPFCAIHDSTSWLCQWDDDGAPKTKFGMQAGRYVEVGTCATDPGGPVFYQVSAWRWWRVRVREWLFSGAARSTRMPSNISH